MKTSNHARKRMNERGINREVVAIMEAILPAKYRNHSCQVFLNRKKVRHIAGILRKAADRVEKHSGTSLVLDETGSTLITTYRKR